MIDAAVADAPVLQLRLEAPAVAPAHRGAASVPTAAHSEISRCTLENPPSAPPPNQPLAATHRSNVRGRGAWPASAGWHASAALTKQSGSSAGPYLGQPAQLRRADPPGTAKKTARDSRRPGGTRRASNRTQFYLQVADLS
jgi:hypothetical protein